MPDPNKRDETEELIDAAKQEIVGMGKQGLDHPTTKPVLIGAGIGTVAGILLLHGAWPIGLAAGAGIALYQQIKKRK